MSKSSGDVGSSPALRVGLIGSGKMGINHLKAIRMIPNAEVVGIADPAANEETLRPLIPAGARIVKSAAELLEQIKPDVVHIVTPQFTHTELALQALRAGCHVYVEKPFTPTRADAERIVALAQERGLKVVAGHQVLFELPNQIAHEKLPEIGDVVHVESFFSFRMVRRTITRVEQCKDILPHAVYPLVDHLRRASGDRESPITLTAVDASAAGDVYALLRLGKVTGLVTVTLSGRPVEQFQNIIGTNGSIRADYIIGGVVHLSGPGDSVGVLFTPYRRSSQTVAGANRGIFNLFTSKVGSYRGLKVLTESFYQSIRDRTPAPMSPSHIVDTVDICERIGQALDASEAIVESAAEQRVVALERALPPADRERGVVLVTGGTGMLGKPVVTELRHAGFPVRVLSRRVPKPSQRVAGVEYLPCDLGGGVDATLLDGVSLVVHCAAETAGGKDEHIRNSITATKNLIEAAARAGTKRFIHVSSVAVLKPGRQVRGPIDEQTPVDADNLGRGPYVWGKAESEVLVQKLGRDLGVDVKVVRPGPLVDYADFHAAGRLGRELGPWYVAIGGRHSPLSVCDVWTGARVIRSYATSFDQAPPVLNMLEGKSPTRKELVTRMLEHRPDLKVIWFPGWLLRLANGPAMLAQRFLLGMKKPMDVYGAFASERYRTDLANTTIERAGPSVIVRR